MHRRATAAVYAVFILNGFAFASWASRIPQVRDGLELNPRQLGFVLLAIAVGSLISMPMAGVVISRLGAAWTIRAMSLVLAVMGSFGLTGNMTGPATVLIFAVVGWLLRHYGYSVPAAVIGMLLGAMAEKSLLHSYQISGGDLAYVLERPVTMIILALLLVSLFGQHLVKWFRRRQPLGA